MSSDKTSEIFNKQVVDAFRTVFNTSVEDARLCTACLTDTCVSEACAARKQKAKELLPQINLLRSQMRDAVETEFKKCNKMLVSVQGAVDIKL